MDNLPKGFSPDHNIYEVVLPIPVVQIVLACISPCLIINTLHRKNVYSLIFVKETLHYEYVSLAVRNRAKEIIFFSQNIGIINS